MSKNIAASVKPYMILTPSAMAATASGTGLKVTPGELYDAVAIALIGATSGTPDSFTVAITVENSATVGGTYTTIGTFATAVTASETGQIQITIDPTKPFIRATATIAFVNGTSPKINVGVVLLVRQSVNSDSNLQALA